MPGCSGTKEGGGTEQRSRGVALHPQEEQMGLNILGSACSLFQLYRGKMILNSSDQSAQTLY